MKKLCMLVAIFMMMAFITAVNVDARSGGLPDISVDKSIKDCDCKLFPACCAQQPVAEPTPAPVKEKVTLTLNVQFDTDKAVVKEKYHDDIKKVADFMKEFPDTTAEIGGHTDSTASNDYNQKLSERRADSVRQYMIDKFGIDGSRLTAKGYGEDNPIASNDTAEGRQQNRRVEAVLEAMRVK
jgi:outer membrane protein OmpA-like peptidoglycan-associated protein